MRRFIRQITDIGIRADTAPEEANVFRIMNALCSMTAVMCLLFAAFCVFFGLWLPFWVAAVFFVGMFCPPLLLFWGRVSASKIFFIAQYGWICLSLCWLFGPVTRGEYGALNIPIFIFIFFRKRQAIALIVSGFLGFLACKAIIDWHAPTYVPDFPRVFEYFVSFVNFCCFFATVYFFITESVDSHGLLKEKNDLLAAALADQKKSQARTEQLNGELKQFASLASHDMKEPLRTISSFSSLLARRVPAEDASAQDFLNFIKDAAQRMARLLDDLIGYARAGVATEAATPVSLDEALRKVENNLFLLISQKNATVERLHPLPTVRGHETLFIQLFQNLVANAIKFQKAEAAPLVQIFTEKGLPEGRFAIVVRDNGIGIGTEFLEQIFEPFRRLHGRSEFDGSGIGLATCKKIMDFYEGQIEVRSEPGAGADFRLLFPDSMLEKSRAAAGSGAVFA